MAIRVKHQRFIQRFILAAAALLLLSVSSVADVVVDWNAIAVEAPPPAVVGPAHARILGYVHAAIYDAVNGIDRRHAPYMVTASAPAGASAEAAAAAAAHGVLARLYPAQQATLDAALAKSLQAIPDGTPKTDGAAFGAASPNVSSPSAERMARPRPSITNTESCRGHGGRPRRE
jgi:hypothetical protein